MDLRSEVLNVIRNIDFGLMTVKDLHPIIHFVYTTVNNYFNCSYEEVEDIFVTCCTKLYYMFSTKKGSCLKVYVVIKNDYAKVKRAVDECKYDTLPKSFKTLVDKLNVLLNIPQPEQKSKEWFKMREEMITASDGSSALGESHYPTNKQYHFVLKKTGKGKKFEDNIYTHHGKKYERIAILIYEHRNNVQLLDFGLLKHDKVSFLGASPDSICNILSLYGDTLTLLGCRMVEIKCPVSRKILFEGPINGTICPHDYWVQVQLQLECCDLNECDFWQCRIEEYPSKNAYVEEMQSGVNYLSKRYNKEHGAIIQLLPHGSTNVFEAKYLYPPSVRLSFGELEKWINENSHDVQGYRFDKVIWWKLCVANRTLITRDKEWFSSKHDALKNIWDIVLYFRKNPDKLDLWVKYIETVKTKKNDDIMKQAKRLVYDNGRGSNAKRLVEDIEHLKKQADRVYTQAETEKFFVVEYTNTSLLNMLDD